MAAHTSSGIFMFDDVFNFFCKCDFHIGTYLTLHKGSMYVFVFQISEVIPMFMTISEGATNSLFKKRSLISQP